MPAPTRPVVTKESLNEALDTSLFQKLNISVDDATRQSIQDIGWKYAELLRLQRKVRDDMDMLAENQDRTTYLKSRERALKVGQRLRVDGHLVKWNDESLKIIGTYPTEVLDAYIHYLANKPARAERLIGPIEKQREKVPDRLQGHIISCVMTLLMGKGERRDHDKDDYIVPPDYDSGKYFQELQLHQERTTPPPQNKR